MVVHNFVSWKAKMGTFLLVVHLISSPTLANPSLCSEVFNERNTSIVLGASVDIHLEITQLLKKNEGLRLEQLHSLLATPPDGEIALVKNFPTLNLNQLDSNTQKAIREYVLQGEMINRELRGNKSALGIEIKGLVSEMDSAFTGSSPMPSGATLYRGTVIPASQSSYLTINKLFTDRGFVSTSIRPSVAMFFMFRGNIIKQFPEMAIYVFDRIHIDSKNKLRGINISQGIGSVEAEIILERGKIFKVVKIETINDHGEVVVIRDLEFVQ